MTASARSRLSAKAAWLLSLLVLIHAMVPIGHHLLGHRHAHVGHACVDHGHAAGLGCNHDGDHTAEAASSEPVMARGIARFAHNHDDCESHAADEDPNAPLHSHDCDDECPWCALALVKFMTPAAPMPVIVAERLTLMHAASSQIPVQESWNRTSIRGPPIV